MVNEENQTILDRLNAAWGLVQEVNNKYEKAEKLVKSKQVNQALAILQLALTDLTNAYRLCLLRRNKRYLLNFRTLEIFPSKVDEINSATASLEAQIQKVKEQIQVITKEEALNVEIRMKKTPKKDRELLFTFAKRVVDLLEKVPNLEDSKQMVDFLKSKGSFEGLSLIAIEVKNFWERVVTSSQMGKVVIKGEKFDNLPVFKWLGISFVDCKFNFKVHLQHVLGGSFEKCHFSASVNCVISPESSIFLGCKFERIRLMSISSSSYHECHFNNVGSAGQGCEFKAQVTNCKFNNLSGSFYFSGIIIKNCSFDGNIGPINFVFGPAHSTHYPQEIENLTFRRMSIKKGEVGITFSRSNIGGTSPIKNIIVDASSLSHLIIEETSAISGLHLSSCSFIHLRISTAWNYIQDLRMKGISVTKRLHFSSHVDGGLIKGCQFNDIYWNCLGYGYYIKNIRMINTLLRPTEVGGQYHFQECVFDDVIFKGYWANATFTNCKFEDCNTKEALRLDFNKKEVRKVA